MKTTSKENTVTMDPISALRQALITALEPIYGTGDPAHTAVHFEEVYITAKELRDATSGQYRDELLLCTAYIHDLFASSHRTVHEVMSGDFVRDGGLDWLDKVLTSEELWLLEHACREHRASYEGGFTTPYSALFNAADRERPKGWRAIYDRAWLFTSHQHEGKWIDPKVITQQVIDHLDDKFGSSGYASYPEIYEEVYGDALQQQRKDIDGLVVWVATGHPIASYVPK